ncbi:MAG: hypothetical protein RLZZ30_187 [Bacteroidota bacterium]|jgi:hypothetical protein
MKIKFTLISIIFTSLTYAQQIANSNMESWDNLGLTTEEPTNWNGFKSGTGGLVSFGSQQVEQSTAIRANATGMYCARIWSKSTLGVVANGTLTLGQINMGSTTASSALNFNYSKTADTLFSEPISNVPDSAVFWAKYTAGSGQQARIHAIVHDSFDVHDPIDAASQPHVVARAELNYAPTGGNWVRFSTPFVYEVQTGQMPTPQFILMTFATNKNPGGGAANDEVLIDDIELIYNASSVNELHAAVQLYYSSVHGLMAKDIPMDTKLSVYSISGQLVKQAELAQFMGKTLPSGQYILKFEGKTQKLFIP